MSGTSLDGVDLAEVEFKISDMNGWSFRIVNAETVAYPSDWRKRLGDAVGFSEEKLKILNVDYTLYLSEVINYFINTHKIKNLDAVCSHGHTILHQPDEGLTLQIGNLPNLALLIEQKVVCDFRVQDVKLGGQGAPLVPIGDRLLFNEFDYCVNLGGFANLSFEKEEKRIAYDICPANIVLNVYAEKLGFPYDDKGRIAASGVLNNRLLEQLNSLDFYEQKPPKSLGLEWVQKNVMPILDSCQLSSEDVLQTFTSHIAYQISRHLKSESSVLLTGGGAFNEYLISMIRNYKNFDIVVPSKEIIEFKEALIFSLLGVLKLRGEINCLASVTGAKHDHSSGNIFHKKVNSKD